MKIRRLLYLILLVALCTYLVWSGRKVRQTEASAVCTGISIEIRDSSHLELVSREELLSRLAANGLKCIGDSLHRLPLNEIEARIRSHPVIRDAEAFVTHNGMLHVEISQRVPVLRIINAYGEQFYLDREGLALRPVTMHTAHVPVATGHIPVRYAAATETKTEDSVVNGLLAMADYLSKHAFWNAQVQEIHVQPNGDMLLIPGMGPVILFGTWDRADEKFDNLITFYRKGLNKMGWDTYKQINVKYQGQVIGTRK